MGAEPLTQVVIRPGDVGPGVGVTGPLRGELGSIEGVEVSVTGPATANQPPVPPRAVDVRHYTVLMVGELPAHAGVLTKRGDALWLVGEHDTLELAPPVPEAVARLVGRHVFVAGTLDAGKLRAQAFGAIGR